LTIEPGTTILGGSDAYLTVLAGSKIEAAGTQTAPIIFDSVAHYEGAPAASGQWGGLTVLGNAQNNKPGVRYEVDEADADFAYGSETTANNGESSGTLTYVEIRNSGIALGGENKEVNGLSLAGVGSGTTVNNIKVINSGDDCLEAWGGTVNMSNIELINCKDDSLDLDEGYTGTVSNVVVELQEPGASGFEFSNGGDAAIVRTNPTIDGFRITTVAGQIDDGGAIFLKKDGITGTFTNGTIIHNGEKGAITSSHELAGDAAAALSFTNVNIINNTANADFDGPAASQIEAAIN
jgi:hypothetical protein